MPGINSITCMSPKFAEKEWKPEVCQYLGVGFGVTCVLLQVLLEHPRWPEEETFTRQAPRILCHAFLLVMETGGSCLISSVADAGELALTPTAELGCKN